ncbi:MAG: TolB-like protein/tetratricopeptide (TPR) repeat protein [Paraglaciecola sp.]
MSLFLNRLVAQFRRRKVVPVILTYAVAGWLILQIAGITFEPLGFPDWSIRMLIIVTIAGFPAVFFLTWLIDFTQEGIMFDLPLWPSEGGSPIQQKKPGQMVAILLSLLVIVGTGSMIFYLLEQFPESESTVVDNKVTGSPLNSIAVLAFENLYGKAESDYFAAGLAEEILNFLAGIRELNVAARTSSFRFRGEQVDIRDVAKLLNVKHVLQGSVRREGNRIRVTAQLIDGEKGYHVWNKTYARNLDDVFAIQQEIASSVVNELKIALSVDSKNRLQKTSSENIEAYIFYLQGREKLHSSQDADVMLASRQLFNEALKIEPAFSRAYAGICETDLRLYEISNSADDFSTAEKACDKAQNLSKGLTSEVQVAIGRLYGYRGWYEKAVEQLNAAIAISPTSVDAYIALGEVLTMQLKFDEGESAFLRAVDLKRNYWKAHEALAKFYYETERYQDSANAYKVVTRLTPDSSVAFAAKGAVYWMLGDTQQALTAYERSLQLKPTRQAYTNIGSFYYYADQFDKAVTMQMQALKYAPDDHRLWGRLAESYRFIPGQRSASQAAYSKAAELALSNLEINPDDWLTRGKLGLYYAHLDSVNEATVLLEQAVKKSQRDPEVLYLQALSYLRVDNVEEALNLLAEAVAQDEYFRLFIGLDPDLQALKDDTRFSLLLPLANTQ